jgi:hypothetical protein
MGSYRHGTVFQAGSAVLCVLQQIVLQRGLLTYGDRLSIRLVHGLVLSVSRGCYTRDAVAKSRRPQSPKRPVRVRPTEALPDIVERIVPRRQVAAEDGDVVITRERVPRLNPHAMFAVPWRYCLRIYPDPQGSAFTSFQNAASEAEHYATVHHARVLYVEDESPTVLADYRRR